jgi:hypothetical protein
MKEPVALMSMAKMLSDFVDNDDLNKQLLFRKMGNLKSEN